MGKINVLSFEVANLIAAGEVVDRPASVLKELLENAIDAGGTNIVAEIRGGGVRMIRVTDNGCGMTSEDLPLALKRHATSKIAGAEDLNGITTLGFRGEALAAISAVSTVRIITKTAEAESGTMLLAEAGSIQEVCEIGCADGTTVTVEHLFRNVPARRKFLKKDTTESMAVAALVEKVAISRPDIAFRLIIDGAVRFSTSGNGKLSDALYAVLGRDFTRRLIPVEGSIGGVSVRGYIGTGDNVRGNRNYQNVFINNRYIKSRTVMAALEQAYTSYIAPEKFPVCALFLEVEPSTVDVNVHPAKLEVKFSDERVVFETVYFAVKTALEQNESRPEIRLQMGKRQSEGSVRGAFVAAGERPRGEQMTLAVEADQKRIPMPPPLPKPSWAGTESTPTEKYNVNNKQLYTERTPPSHAADSGNAAPSAPRSVAASAAPTMSVRDSLRVLQDFAEARREAEQGKGKPAQTVALETATATDETAQREQTAVAHGEEARESEAFAPPYRIVGEAFHCYVMVETGEELLLIDKHAAHERILFEELKAKLDTENGVGAQTLLLPLAVKLSPEEYSAALENKQALFAVGFEFSPSEDGVLCLTAIPRIVSVADAEDLLVRMAGDLFTAEGDPHITDAIRRERALYQIACKAAIKGGRAYDDSHIQWLVEKVMALPDITVCPHGRPIAMRMTKNQLDSQFKRI